MKTRSVKTNYVKGITAKVYCLFTLIFTASPSIKNPFTYVSFAEKLFADLPPYVSEEYRFEKPCSQTLILQQNHHASTNAIHIDTKIQR